MGGFRGSLIGNHISRVQLSRDRWRHVTPKGQGRDPKIFEAPYLHNGERYKYGYNWPATGNYALRCEFNGQLTDDVTWPQKVKVAAGIVRQWTDTSFHRTYIHFNVQFGNIFIRHCWVVSCSTRSPLKTSAEPIVIVFTETGVHCTTGICVLNRWREWAMDMWSW